MRRRRVKITGVGPVTPAGIGREAFWRGIQEPVSYIKPFTKLDAKWGEFIAGTVDDEMLKQVFVDARSDHPRHLARHSWFGAGAALLAVIDSGLALDELHKMSTAVVIGTSVMDFGSITQAIHRVARKGMRGVMPRVVETANVTQVATAISETLEITGSMQAVQSSCCSGLDAVGAAAAMIAGGDTDLAICGGAESPLFLHPMLEFRAAQLTPATIEKAERHCRPFDLWRTTGTISEGAAMMVLEPEESPRPAYAWIAGHSFYNDRDGVLCGGLSNAIKSATADAGLRLNEIEVLSASGPGHREVDAAESKVLTEVFGDSLERIAAYSIKGAIGNSLGGAPAIQLAAAAIGLERQGIPPTVNWSYPDPACPLNLSSSARVIPHDNCLINSHGRGGENAAMVITR